MATDSKIRISLIGDSRSLEQASKRGQASLGKLSKSANRLAGSLAAGFGGAVVIAGIGRAINKIAEFEKTMRRVAIISKGSEKELSKLALTLGKSTVFSATEAGKAMQFLAQAGFSANQIIAATPGVLELAAAGQLDLARAADIASNVLSAYGFEASRINEINDLLVITTNNANTNIEQFAEAFKVAGPIAKAAGVEINTLAGLIGVLGDSGIQGSLAGTQLRAAISRLISPSEEAAGVLKRLGVETKDANGELRPMTDIFADLGKAGLTAEDAFAIFEQRAASGAVVMSQAAEKARELAEATKEVGVSSKQAAEQLDTLSGDIKLMESKWDGAIQKGGKWNWLIRQVVFDLGELANMNIIWSDSEREALRALEKLNRETKTGSADAALYTEAVKLSGEALNDQIVRLIASGEHQELVNRLLEESERRTRALAKAELDAEISRIAAERARIAGLELTKEELKLLTQKRKEQEKLTAALMSGKAFEKAPTLVKGTLDSTENDQSGFKSGLDEKIALLSEFQQAAFALTQDRINKEEGALDDAADKDMDRRKALFAAAQQLSNTLFTSISAMQSNSMAAELEAAGDNEKEKDAIRIKYAKKQQQMAIAQALINAALAIGNAFATMPWPAAPIVAGIAGAAALAQVAVIASQKFAAGTSFAPGGQALVGERGPEVVNLPRGSSVTPHGQSKGMLGGITINVSGVVGDEYLLARTITTALKNQQSNVARTTF